MKIANVNIVEFDLQSKTIRALTADTLVMHSEDKTKLYWIHYDLNNVRHFSLLAKKLALPRHVKTLCKKNDNIPQLINMGETLTFQIECPLTTKIIANDDMEFSTLIFYLTPTFCFTATRGKMPVLTEFIGMQQNALQFAQTPRFILFLLCESVINDYSKILFNE